MIDIKVCVYDNPDTMARECWQNGKLVMHYQSDFLMKAKKPILIFIANIGDWKAGQISGDKSAMTRKAVTK